MEKSPQLIRQESFRPVIVLALLKRVQRWVPPGKPITQ